MAPLAALPVRPPAPAPPAGQAAGQAEKAAPASFEALYDEHFAFVWRNARRLGADPGLVDDVVQDTFLVVHRKLPEFEQRAQVRTWLFAILRRVLSDYRRTQRRRPAGVTAPADLDRLHADERGGDHASRLEAAELVGHALAALDDDKREVFVLVELEQMTLAEAAEALDINRNTAWSRLRAARQSFEAALDRLERSTP